MLITRLCAVLLIGLTATGCGTTRQRIPGLACTALDPALRLSQGFVAHGQSLASARILVKTLNSKWRRSEALTLTLLDAQGHVIAQADQSVKMGYRGWVEFRFSEPGVSLCKGERYVLRVAGSRDLSFGWYHRDDFYSGGIAYQNGVGRPGLDWYFKLVWATETVPAQIAAHRTTPSLHGVDQRHTALQAATL
ncbi:MAG: hypothetical protein QGH42_00540 [Kiritimatiellia bacterium]|jgi:hypothetical protein|nr:hypothetical protein [Kiritimatiellia bacterium]MDP6630964.1 hypothetical protein [Kiritimatiellia bacterium]MDP6810287.1 hypothetical protein [Kiritimatiellia bacterium]MDP7022724.1 hypothetical protein [Kiritimatiellia bacterium]